jgi:hypothetical protein
MQIGSVAKRIGLTPDAIRFYERNALLPRPPRTEGRLPPVRRKRRRNASLHTPGTGHGIQAQRDSEFARSARKPFAAMRTCAASIAGKALR